MGALSSRARRRGEELCRLRSSARSGSGIRPSMAPATTFWYSEPSIAAVPPPATNTMVALGAEARTTAAGIVEHPDHTHHRRWIDGPPVVLVVERDVARDDRQAERLAGQRHPLDRLGQLVADVGGLGVSEVEAVGDRGRPGAGAGDVPGGLADGLMPPRRGSSQVRRPLPSSATAIARCDGVSRTTAASPPGRMTVPEPTRWSYCRVIQRRLAIFGRPSSARNVAVGSAGRAGRSSGRSRSRAGRAARPGSAGSLRERRSPGCRRPSQPRGSAQPAGRR